MKKYENLTPWSPGQSGNPAGRPKGAKSWSAVVAGLLDDPAFLARITKAGLVDGHAVAVDSTAMEAIAIVQIIKAIKGDDKAAEWLRKIELNSEKTTEKVEPPVALVKFI